MSLVDLLNGLIVICDKIPVGCPPAFNILHPLCAFKSVFFPLGVQLVSGDKMASHTDTIMRGASLLCTWVSLGRQYFVSHAGALHLKC